MNNRLNIKTGDTVMVIAGDNMKDVGKTGKVLKVFPSTQRVIVQGRNIQYRHTKARKQGEKGGRIEQEGPIHVSNVMLVCPNCKKPTRIGHTFVEKNGRQVKIRVCRHKECGKAID